jgi:hypothetical protein
VILSLALAAVVVIGAVTCAIYFLTVKAPLAVAHGVKEETADSAARVANSFRSVFNFTPQVTVNGVTEIEQANSVMELATASQGVVEHYQWSQTWFGSTKTMELQGTYQAKAGFDLHQPFKVSMDAKRITATLPAPKLLSIEMEKDSFKILRDEDGWWNKISAGDRERAISAMQEEARSKAAQSGILEEAKTRFKQQFGDMVKGLNIPTPIETRFGDEAPTLATPGNG